MKTIGHVTAEVLTDFLKASRADVFDQWQSEELPLFLAYHKRQRGVGVVEIGGRIAGVAVAWRSHRPDIDDPWTRWDDTGTCLYVSQLHVSDPGALCMLLTMLAVRIPEWRTLTILGRRNGKVRVIPQALIDRLFARSRDAFLKNHGH